MKSKLRFGFLLAIFTLILSVNVRTERLDIENLLSLVNQDRVEHGLPALTLDPVLNLAAMAKAQDMTSKNYFAHTSPSGATPWHWFKTLGYAYTYAGENLAEGYTDAIELEQSWMSSETHRANILSPHYSDVGLAIVSHNQTNLIVQLFGSKNTLLTLSNSNK
jgi:uncharacterized protein YkwD